MNFAFKRARALATLVVVSSPALAADEEPQDEPLHFGIQLLAALPSQDLKAANRNAGIGLGVFAEAEVGPGTIAQTRLDFIRYPQTNRPGAGVLPDYVPAGALTLSGSSAALGVDFRHALPQPALEGAFLLAGVMGIRYEFQTSDAEVAAGPNGEPVTRIVRTKQNTSTRLGLALGAGCSFTPHWTLTLRYTYLGVDSTSLATLETGLSYRY